MLLVTQWLGVLSEFTLSLLTTLQKNYGIFGVLSIACHTVAALGILIRIFLRKYKLHYFISF